MSLLELKTATVAGTVTLRFPIADADSTMSHLIAGVSTEYCSAFRE
jgi:hypothetical protein